MSKAPKNTRWGSKKYLLGTTAIVAAMGLQSAIAQEADPAQDSDDNEVITVTGVRGALLTARNQI